MYISRDPDLDFIQARKDHRCYGMGLGVILLDDVYPGFPGDVRNASAFPYPIQYEIATDVDIHQLVVEEDKSDCLEPILRAAKMLEKMGCRAIISECGYFAYFHREIRQAVSVPVFSSSLLQVPFAQSLISPEKQVGILLAAAPFITERHFQAVGIDPQSNIKIFGAMDDGACPEFHHLWTRQMRTDPPSAWYEKARDEFVAQGVRFYQENPDLSAMVLECTGFPPFARALQRQIDIPVFSYSTLMDYAYSVVVHRDFYGHV